MTDRDDAKTFQFVVVGAVSVPIIVSVLFLWSFAAMRDVLPTFTFGFLNWVAIMALTELFFMTIVTILFLANLLIKLTKTSLRYFEGGLTIWVAMAFANLLMPKISLNLGLTDIAAIPILLMYRFVLSTVILFAVWKLTQRWFK